MLLSCVMLSNVCGVNGFDYAGPAEFSEGDTPTLYLQLIDLSQNRATAGFVPPGRRYIPSVGATLMVTLDNIDSAKKVVRAATQPYAQDPSIWSVPILSTDSIKGTVTLRLQLTEGVKVTNGTLKAAVLVAS